MAVAHTLGFPRIGAQRELKFALESFWRGETTEAALRDTGRTLRARHWAAQQAAGLDFVTVGDFAWYDQVLNTLALLGATPDRFAHSRSAAPLTLQDYFTMARGSERHFAMEMTKWFDTNYHYLVPEWTAELRFDGGVDWLFDEVAEAAALGHRAKVVLLGPLSLLYLGKIKDGLAHKLDLLPRALAAYQKVLARLRAAGVEWVQLDEPVLALDLDEVMARRVCAHLRGAGAARAEDSAGHLLRRSGRACRLAARTAGGRRASGPGARRGPARRLSARLAGGARAVGRRDRRPQHLARRPGSRTGHARTLEGQAGREPVDRAQLLAAARAGRSGAGSRTGRRAQRLAGVRRAKAR